MPRDQETPPMDADRAARELKVIRQLMERPIRYSTMSGLSGIVAGCAALAGLAADWYFWRRHAAVDAMWINMGVWAGVFLVAFAGVAILTRLRERGRGMPFWSSVKRRILLTILPPFLAGAGLTAGIVYRWYFDVGPNQWGLIPSLWMLFYGVALWQVGAFSAPEVRILGTAFLAAGLVTAPLYQTHPYWALGVTFGGFHIVYGLAVWIRHGG
jgi:hypothetical protein